MPLFFTTVPSRRRTCTKRALPLSTRTVARRVGPSSDEELSSSEELLSASELLDSAAELDSGSADELLDASDEELASALEEFAALDELSAAEEFASELLLAIEDEDSTDDDSGDTLEDETSGSLLEEDCAAELLDSALEHDTGSADELLAASDEELASALEEFAALEEDSGPSSLRESTSTTLSTWIRADFTVSGIVNALIALFTVFRESLPDALPYLLA